MSRAGDVDDPATLRVDQEPSAGVEFVLFATPDTGAPPILMVDGTQPRVLVGKSPACSLRLDDPHVSRRHAAIDVQGNVLRITDLGSRNGTFVNGVRVIDALLAGGETVRLGRTELHVQVRSQGPKSALPNQTTFRRVLGASVAMRRLYPACVRLAAADVPVVIEGETGTGKELLAESIHEASARAGGPFVVFDCTAVSPSLVESELFGHERGAFTGATGMRRGVFELAHKGTLLVDEIGDLEPSMQPKLLRAVERGEIRRVGGEQPIRVDVRLVAATRRDLDAEVQAGRFRDDLFHRIAVARIELPPLRERRGDVAMLARFFIEQMGGDPGSLPAHLLSSWVAYSWPGNVRELRNAVARWMALGDVDPRQGGEAAGDTDVGDDLLARALASDLPFPRARDLVLEEFERRYVSRLLDEHHGDVAAAAAASGIGRRYFQMLRARTRK
ncbi:MAG TPA: sigma 54-interacting transcriptional regulator [Polyangiaceae bacterium]